MDILPPGAALDYDAYDAILHHIFKQTQGDAWFKPAVENVSTGVCLRVEPGEFRVFPYENPALEPFEAAVRSLNPEVAVKMRSAAVHAALANVEPDQTSFILDAKNKIQILETISELGQAEKEQYAAFIRDERVLVVWADRIDDIIPSVLDFESRLLKLVWKSRSSGAMSSTLGRSNPNNTGSVYIGTAPYGTPSSSRSKLDLASLGPTAQRVSRMEGEILRKEFESGFADRDKEKEKEKDLESGEAEKEGGKGKGKRSKKGKEKKDERPTRLLAPVYIGLATTLAAFFVANGVNILLTEWWLDRSYLRFALLATAPLVFCVSLFFALQIVNTLSFIFGPVSQYHENSKYYSAIPPSSSIKIDRLPHVTIQMPVYKESLEATIAPSVESIKKAIFTYARQGGSSSIFVCDDGLQLLSERDREERIAFYAHNGIGWVARPPHSTEKTGFKRAGRFKKASNMNYGLKLSLRMEEIMLEMQGDPSRNPFADEDPELEEKALKAAVEETARTAQAWAQGGKALRVGEVILIVDSDTQVPEDCFRDAVRELQESPEVAIIQHESDVMQVAHHYFENAIAYFTRRINHCISIACANGEVAPFVGHNAFLRWSAVQEAAFVDPADGQKKFWSESHVSEDFDMSLRLQLKGYIVRWATYSRGGFTEGVSLTCDDELNRWMKYSYGCSELIFNPFSKWLFKGPITKQLHRFLWSPVPLHYKISMMSYMFSYYGIAASMTLSVLNYVLLGFTIPIDGYYMRSWEIWLACTVVFPGAGNIGMTMLDYRLNQKDLLSAFLENVKWIPFFFFFFGGLSLHVSGAILSHLFGLNMTWSATKKEVEVSNFFKEVPKILKRFWLSLLICWVLIAAMVILSTPLIPLGWRVTGEGWAVIFPLAIQTGCHILFPIALNPWLMIFSY